MQLDANDPSVVRVVEDAVLGAQVRQFMESDIGVYLMQRADDYAQEAIDRLTRVDPEDPKTIRVLQNQIAVADLIASWLKEATAVGQQAELHLKELARG